MIVIPDPTPEVYILDLQNKPAMNRVIWVSYSDINDMLNAGKSAMHTI
jgi:hypothetical protein